jgi:hypothetical protein
MGTELRLLSGAREPTWIAVIGAIRAVYDGVLTYAANATFPGDEFTSVSFWDQVDVLGLDAYFNLTGPEQPDGGAARLAWSSNRFGEKRRGQRPELRQLRGKPVIFTEIGYKSTDRANVELLELRLSAAPWTPANRGTATRRRSRCGASGRPS